MDALLFSVKVSNSDFLKPVLISIWILNRMKIDWQGCSDWRLHIYHLCQEERQDTRAVSASVKSSPFVCLYPDFYLFIITAVTVQWNDIKCSFTICTALGSSKCELVKCRAALPADFNPSNKYKLGFRQFLWLTHWSPALCLRRV